MAKNNSKSEEVKAQPADNTANASVGSASKPALAPTPEVENTNPDAEANENTSKKAKSAKSSKSEDKEESKSGEESFETTVPVSFVVDRKVYEGTKFSFPADVVEDRKRIVREAYGEVVK